MENLLESGCCKIFYNSNERRPVIIQKCGHTVCEVCFNFLKARYCGYIICPFDQEESEQDSPVYNYEILSKISRIEVPCDSCDCPSEYVCTGCMKFQCGANCYTSHNCPNKFQMDLTQINLANLLIEKINTARQHRQAEPHRYDDIRKKSCAELKVELRREEEGKVFLEFCFDHPTLEGEFLDIRTLSFKCKICELDIRRKENEERKKYEDDGRPFQARISELLHLQGIGKIEAKDLLNQLIRDRFVHKESFLIPPTLLKYIGTSEVSQLTKILKFLDSDKSFMPHCVKCLVKLTNDTAFKYPCAKAHLICRNCQQDCPVQCPFDGNRYNDGNFSPVILETLYTQTPACTICTESSELRVLVCDHSFCTACIAKTWRCPICNNPLALDPNLYPIEPFLCYFTKLVCFNDDENAVKISNQTGQVFCAKCFTSENVLHTFSEIPPRPQKFLDRLISEGLVHSIGGEFYGRESSDVIIELRDMVASIPTASRELIDLLNQFPHISLSDRANLVYYVRTDLTNCYVLPEKCVGWRIPFIKFPNLSVVMRFRDVLPPQFCTNITRPSRSPWHVDLSKRQIEIVGLTMLSTIELHGIVMATSYGDSSSPSLESFEVFNAEYIQELGEVLMLSYHSEKLYSFNEREPLTGPLNHKVVMLPRPFEFMAETPYIIKFSLSGSKTFYRGNPFTLDRHRSVSGQDGTFFTFLECLTTSDKCLYGRNDLSGPLLGFVYKSR